MLLLCCARGVPLAQHTARLNPWTRDREIGDLRTVLHTMERGNYVNFGHKLEHSNIGVTTTRLGYGSALR